MKQSILTYGSLKNLPEKVSLRAGNLDLVYETGFIRYIKCGRVEVIRMINHLLRDADWDTAPMKVYDEQIVSKVEEFVITYKARCQSKEIDFLWDCRIEGLQDSSIIFTIQGKAKSHFKKNRAGFTVMHPISNCRGIPVKITDTNGRSVLKEFPRYISAKQPFFDIAAMEWKPNQGMTARLSFEGDVFETEDQRNWTDASYKTYCTPLAKPFPKTLEVGETIAQTIRLEFSTNHLDKTANEESYHIQFNKEKTIPVPKIGTVFNKLPHDKKMLSRLGNLHLDFLRVELKLAEWDAHYLQNAAIAAESTGCTLEVVLFFGEMEDTHFIKLLAPYKGLISRFILFSIHEKSTTATIIDRAQPLLKKHFPKSVIGAGTDAFFKELNDYRVSTGKIDFLTFSINPQVHAFDIDSLTETLEAQRDVVDTCKHFSKGKKVAVGPVSLRMRWNPNATTLLDKNLGIASFTEDLDARQLSLYGAAWMLGSFKNLSESGAEAITFFQTSGKHGLMFNANDPWPSMYETPKTGVYPMYLVLQKLMAQKGKQMIPVQSSNPLVFDGIAWADDLKQATFLITNYSASTINVDSSDSLKIENVWSLDAQNAHEFMIKPDQLNNPQEGTANNTITLPPFGISMFQVLEK